MASACGRVWVAESSLGGSSLFRGISLLPYWTAVWGVWRLGAHFGLFVTVVELAVSNFCGVAGRIVLPGETAAIGSFVAMGGCALE